MAKPGGISDIMKAALLKAPVQTIMKRLYDNVYYPKVYNNISLHDKAVLEQKGEYALEEQIISDVFKKDIMQAFAIQYKRKNVAVASLQGSKLNKIQKKGMLDYIAFNCINSPTDLKEEELIQIEGRESNRSFEICYRNNHLPMKRLNINNVKTYRPKALGEYVTRRCACAERKILGTILDQYQKLKIPQGSKVKLGGKLYLYTKMEPCLYCMLGLKEFIKKTNTKLYLMYEELIYEVNRDRIENYPKRIYNLLSPTPYTELVEYDPVLANEIKDDIESRRGIDISERWQPFVIY